MVCLATMIIGLGIGLTACNNERPEESTQTTEPTIYGLWQGVSFDQYDAGEWLDITTPPHDEFAFTITFYEDGTFDGSGYLGNGGGTYTFVGSVITLYKEEQRLYATYRIEELTDDEMEVILNILSSNFRFRLQRVYAYIMPWIDGGTIAAQVPYINVYDASGSLFADYHYICTIIYV